MRILILRLSEKVLNELLSNIWPTLFTLLMQIFSQTQSQQQHPMLLLSGLKLLEIISIMRIEQFFLNHWLFLFDCTSLQI